MVQWWCCDSDCVHVQHYSFQVPSKTSSFPVKKILVKMDGSTSSACAVCFRDGRNRRVLKCLHSFCASCIDQLVLSEAVKGHEHEVACPVCRTWTRLPKNGAGGLPKDTTEPVTVEELQCETCKEKGEAKQPAVWCSTCKCALCYKYLGLHMSSGTGYSSHSIRDLPKMASREMTSERDSISLCEEHNEPLQFYCTTCDVTVCGHCTAIGRHGDHRPIVTMKEVTSTLKKKVQTKADHLERDVLPRVEETISRVDLVGVELTARADNVRADIRGLRRLRGEHNPRL